MNNEKTNCCDTENSDCKTQGTTCCTTKNKGLSKSTKNKLGLGVLLMAIIFAGISACNTENSNDKSSCGSGEESCATSCETESTETSCCSKK